MHDYFRWIVATPKRLFLGVAIVIGLCLLFTYKRQPKSAVLRDLAKFEEKTKAAWGSGIIGVARKAELFSAVTNAPVLGLNSENLLDRTIKQQLHSSILRFIDAYSAGEFEKVFEFHRIAPYRHDLSVFLKDKQALTNMAKLGIAFPQDDAGRVKAIWDYFNSRKNAEDFWNAYVEQVKAKGKSIPEETSEVIKLQTQLLPEFQKDWKENRAKYEPIKITGISTQLMDFKIVKTNSVESFFINRKIFLGAQMRGPQIFVYDETPKDIVADGSVCILAIASIGITHNARKGVVPITLTFYWSPKFQKLVPASITQHSFGGFLVIF